MSQGKNDMVRYHAENCIMEKNNAKQYNYTAHRLECVCNKVDTFIKMKKVRSFFKQELTDSFPYKITHNMAKMVSIIEKVTVGNLDVTINMLEKFENISEELDIQSDKISESITKSMSSTIPSDEVETLINKVKEEHGLGIAETLNSATPRYYFINLNLVIKKSKSPKSETDELIERLKSIGLPKGESGV